jgi:AbrB family looped-hinge helix DNA binding protein
MELAKITSKGQVTIPKNIRELMGLDIGDQIAFLVEDGKVLIIKANVVLDLKENDGEKG